MTAIAVGAMVVNAHTAEGRTDALTWEEAGVACHNQTHENYPGIHQCQTLIFLERDRLVAAMKLHNAPEANIAHVVEMWDGVENPVGALTYGPLGNPALN